MPTMDHSPHVCVHVLLIAPPRRANALHGHLIRAGFMVAIAPTISQGLHFARRHRPHIIVLTDPPAELGADNACYLLRKAPETASVPLLLLNGQNAMTEVILERNRGGGTLCTYLPISACELDTAIEQILSTKPQ